MYLRQILGVLFLLFISCHGFDFNTTECVETCKKEKIAKDDELCQSTCQQSYLEKRVKEANKGQLPKPKVPVVLQAKWRTIQLRFNSTDLANFTALEYILEVSPDWNPYQTKNVFTVFPYLPKYHLTNKTTYSVQKLEPNTAYQFRVIAVQANISSEFSEWSNITWTKKNCSKSVCMVNNMRLELTRRLRYEAQRRLHSEFRWEATTLPEKKYKYKRTLTRLAPIKSWCAESHVFERPSISREFSIREKDIFRNKNLTSYSPENGVNSGNLYYNCWYTLELDLMEVIGFFFGKRKSVAYRKWVFNIPDCIVINGSKNCGCPYVDEKEDRTHSLINATTKTLMNSSVSYITWDGDLWRDDINITYYLLFLSRTSTLAEILKTKEQSAVKNIHIYSTSFSDLELETKYRVKLIPYHSDNCSHHERIYLDFFAHTDEYQCNKTQCTANSTCHPNADENESKCECDDEFVEGSDGKCLDFRSCKRKPSPCSKNERCEQKVGGHICMCNQTFRNMSGTCVPECEAEPELPRCGTNRNFNEDGDKEKIIAGVVPALVFVIIIAVGIIIWLKYFHRKRVMFMEREFEVAIGSSNRATLTNPYGYQNPIELVNLPESSSKEINLLYVLREDLAISDDLKGSIDFHELPNENVRLQSMIGKGAFGEVYVGEARGLSDSSEWTMVAIKTLSVEAIIEEEVYDFLREIELMKDIGAHENVIRMYGCCTRCQPLCLVLEYASGGNLLNYLRSLKKKCKEIATARVYTFINNEKEKFEKFFEPGEMPELSSSYSFPFNPYKKPGELVSSVKEAEAFNLEIASKIKEEIRTALDPMELESFARQIASGMEHIAGLGIVHRDLAARNILLNDSKVLKISDFGLSREGTYVKQTSGKIPFRWLSIEAIVERFYSTASDVWAFGIVLWEICTLGDIPYPDLSDKDLKDFLLSGNRMDKVESCTDDIYEIMLKCWSYLPEDRPSFTQLSKWLWDLEHAGNTYVNVDSLVQQSIEDEGEKSQEKAKKENNNIDSKAETESEADMASLEGLDNQGFCLSEEDLCPSDENRLIRKDKSKLNQPVIDKEKDSCNGIVDGEQ